MQTVYYIGGSPCSGKSTIAEMIEGAYGFRSYKLDEGMFDYMKRAAAAGAPCSKAALEMDFEQTWMRPPALQCEEEFKTYEEMFPFVRADIAAMGEGAPIVAEGAGFLPELMAGLGVDGTHYVCVAPTEAFQRENYAKRPWIGLFLEGCSEPDTAFDNWMSRDALFAKAVLERAENLGYAAITVDGSRGVEEIYSQVVGVFGL